MATLKLQTTELRLSKTEQGTLERSLRDLVSRTSKQRTTELSESFQRRRRFREPLEAELRRVDFDVEKLRRYTNQEHTRLDKAFVARVKGRRERGGRRRGGRPDAVWGLTSGSANPPHDFSWTDHDIIGAPAAGNFSHTANQNSGYLNAYAHGHDSSPKMVDSFAGVGFWYIPNRVGVLSVSIAPPLQELMWTGAVWNDVAAAGGWISLGIASYLREPFRFVEWRVIDTDELWWNVDNWFDWTEHDRDRSAYSMSVSTLVDTSHYYACWAWIEAYAYAENGGSYAGSSVTATVGSFIYNLV
jgi:hypothetical protein